MIIVRCLFVGIVVAIVYVLLLNPESLNISTGGSTDLDMPLFLIGIWFIGNLFLLLFMSGVWNKFGEINGLKRASLKEEYEISRIPSFTGRRLRWSAGVLLGERNGYKFGFFTRLYKEGGILRWRERKIDTVLWVRIDKQLPHMVVDSRFADHLRNSNLAKRYGREQLIHFEGPVGDKYYAYTAIENRLILLQLFTPDVLEVLYDHLPTVDIEIQGHSMWFVVRHGVLNDKLASKLFETFDWFFEEFNKQLRTTTFSTDQQNAVIK